MTQGDKIGYFAAMVETLDQYQGYFIVDTPEMRTAAAAAKTLAIMSGYNPVGTLQATIIESLLTEAHSRAGAAALALRDLTGHSYFVVMGTKLPGGYNTSMEPLVATSIDDARSEIERMPQVIGIKARLMQKIAPKDGSHRRSGFH